MGAALDLTFAALADPTRRAILERLKLGEATVTELAQPFRLSQPTISAHLKVLTRAGLIEQRRDAQFRRCSLNTARMAEAWQWLGGYQQFWEGSFDRLEVLAKQLHQAEKTEKSHESKRKRTR
jgi:DNA-binding transcriptional ArsR family regulator